MDLVKAESVAKYIRRLGCTVEKADPEIKIFATSEKDVETILGMLKENQERGKK